MKLKITSCIMVLSTILCVGAQAAIQPSVVDQTIQTLTSKNAGDKAGIEKGVRQTAALWQTTDGTDQEFQKFCESNYIADASEKYQIFQKISDYLEGINGFNNEISLRLRWNTDINTGKLYPIDEMFTAYQPWNHMSEDFYQNKIAFYLTLNFPHLTLPEKEALGNDRKAWAYARLGDMFTSRVPADILRAEGNASSESDIYIASYNIYMGSVTDKNGKILFPKDMILLAHWNLRDELKADYSKGAVGLDKQRTIYEVMKRIIAQDIPVEMINAGSYVWNPFANTLTQDGKPVQGKAEGAARYQHILNFFHAEQAVDKYTGDTYIDRKFNNEMEISLPDVKTLLDNFLSAPELKSVGKIISKRLNRKLEPFDIWYDGFKTRSNMDEDKLTAMTRQLYPNPEAVKKDLPNILTKMGFTPEKAQWIADKVVVDPARGSGHAWGTGMRGAKSHLRTRIADNGMDYKGYNIAIHEFGHNVEQTISMNDVDYYMLYGVPNTAFTEALAFVFQKNDLRLLGLEQSNPEAESMEVLDKIWGMYEICGVSMVDIGTWEWLYAHPNATAEELRDATIAVAKEVWNKYYMPIFGQKDETILAVYSHMVDTPLYLPAYAIGHLIEFQLSQYFEGKQIATEIERIYSQGRLTPNVWMKQATGNSLTVDPMLIELRKVLKK